MMERFINLPIENFSEIIPYEDRLLIKTIKSRNINSTVKFINIFSEIKIYKIKKSIKMTSNRDLRHLQDSDSIADAFSQLVSGKKYGYKTVIVKDKPVPKCSNCGKALEGNEKFCPECGTKVEPTTN